MVPAPGWADWLSGEVLLLDEQGNLVMEATGLQMRLGGRNVSKLVEGSAQDLLYEIEWRPTNVTEGGSARSDAGTSAVYVVFVDARGVGEKLAESLEKAGARCVRVLPGKEYGAAGPARYEIDPVNVSDYSKLFQAIVDWSGPVPLEVVHVWSLTQAKGLTDAQRYGSESLLLTVQALASISDQVSGRLCLVTGGVQPDRGDREPISIEQSPAWGLGMAVAHEHPELRCKMIDLRHNAGQEDAADLLAELLREDLENRVALRGATRYVARLVPHTGSRSGSETRLAGPGETFR